MTLSVPLKKHKFVPLGRKPKNEFEKSEFGHLAETCALCYKNKKSTWHIISEGNGEQ